MDITRIPGDNKVKILAVALFAGLLLYPSLGAHAQSLATTQPGNLSTDPPPQVDVPRRQVLHGGEAIPRNMVWREDSQRSGWVQVEVNSCEWCGRPMTWKQAAFDNKALPLWLVAAGLAVADTEYTLSRPCLKAGTCTEWNPMLGTTRAQQYGVRMPILAMAWLGTSWLRKGDSERNIGGWRQHWYALPVVFMSMPAAGLVANSVRR